MRVSLKNVKIKGVKVGVRIDGPVFLESSGVEFDNVDQPWLIDGAQQAQIAGTRIRNQPPPARGKSFVGYEGANAPPLPVQCPSCHAIFPSRSYHIRSSRFYGFDNEETCPFCGDEHAKMADGLFDLANQTIQILKAEPLTHAMLAAIKTAASDCMDGKSDFEETVRRVGAVVPRLAKVLTAAERLGLAAATLVTLWFLVFPSHLEAMQTVLGEKPHETYRLEYLIEEACLRSFGEAANCRFVVEPKDDERDMNAGEKEDRDPEPPNAETEPSQKGDTDKETAKLPEHGSLPKSKPSAESIDH